MEATFGGADIWGVPIKGGIVSLDKADVTDILGAASGLATTLVKAGAIGLGIGVVTAYLLLRSLEQRIPISSMARVHLQQRRFNGVCLTKELTFTCGGQTLTVPSEFLKKVSHHTFSATKLRTELIDGSVYDDIKFENPTFEFLTLAGKQTVDVVNDDIVDIKGNTIEEVQQLKTNLTFALRNNAEEVVKTLGKNLFEKYFYKGI